MSVPEITGHLLLDKTVASLPPNQENGKSDAANIN
jgi:hypothetical protein